METNLQTATNRTIFQRRYVIAFLIFLSSVVIQSQRFNLSFALVCMVNDTKIHSNDINTTECPKIMNGTNADEKESAEFSWNAELQGLILGSTYIGHCISQLPGGLLCKRFGVKKLFLVSTIVASLCNLVSPLAARADPYWLFAAHLIKGIAQGLPFAALSLLSARWFPKPEKGFLSAFIFSGYPVGGFLGSSISGLACALKSDGGWPWVFYIFGFFGIFVSILILILYVEHPTDDPNISEKELKYILENISSTEKIERSPTPWGAILSSISTYALVIAMFGQYWMNHYLVTVQPLFMDEGLNIPVKKSGLFTAGPQVVQAITGLIACWFSLWINKNDTSKIKYARKGCNTFAVVIFLFGLGGVYMSGCDIIWNIFFLFVMAASHGFTTAGCLIVAVDMTPTYCGPLMGFLSTVASLSGFILPVLTGKLTKDGQTMEQWHKLFVITMIVAALDGVVFLLWGSTKIQPYDPSYQKEKTPEISSTHL